MATFFDVVLGYHIVISVCIFAYHDACCYCVFCMTSVVSVFCRICNMLSVINVLYVHAAAL